MEEGRKAERRDGEGKQYKQRERGNNGEAPGLAAGFLNLQGREEGWSLIWRMASVFLSGGCERRGGGKERL